MMAIGAAFAAGLFTPPASWLAPQRSPFAIIFCLAGIGWLPAIAGEPSP